MSSLDEDEDLAGDGLAGMIINNRTAARTNCTIGFDGQIRPCSHAFQTYGNISNGLETAWKGMDEWRSDEWIPEQCTNCNQRYSCGGGCKIEALLTNDSFSKPDPYFDITQLPILWNKEKANRDKVPQWLRFNPKLKARDESFGGILYAGKSKWIPVDSELYRFANSKKGGGSFDLSELARVLDTQNEEVVETASHLMSKSILLPARR